VTARAVVQAPAVVVLALALALAGCMSYVPQPLSAQRSLAAARSRSLDDPQLQAEVARHLAPGAVRPPTWTFESLAWAACRLNPDLAVARAKADAAHAGETTAGERPNPTLTLPFEVASNPGAGDSPYTVGLGLDIPIETGGKRDARIAQAAQLSRVAELELGDAAWQVRSRLRAALLDLRHARRDAALLATREMRRAQVAQMLSRRLELGELPRADAEQAEAELAQLRLQQAEAQRAQTQALGGVAEAVGVPLAAVARADIRLDDLDRPPGAVADASALDAALRSRSDVQAALARYEASQAALQLAVASQYPDIHLGPGYTFDGGLHKYALSLSGLELPVFNRHRGEIAQAEAHRRAAAAQFEAAMAQGAAQVDRANAALRDARLQWQLAGQVAQRQDRVAASARRSFDADAIGRLDLALAELQAEAAHQQREDAFDRLLRAAAALEDAVQRPLSDGTVAPEQEHP
jgi:outer membrane protein TolC